MDIIWPVLFLSTECFIKQREKENTLQQWFTPFSMLGPILDFSKKLGPAWHRTGLIFWYKIVKIGSIFKLYKSGPARKAFGPVTVTGIGPSGWEMLLYNTFY
jgi:hypothetical protein